MKIRKIHFVVSIIMILGFCDSLWGQSFDKFAKIIDSSTNGIYLILNPFLKEEFQKTEKYADIKYTFNYLGENGIDEIRIFEETEATWIHINKSIFFCDRYVVVIVLNGKSFVGSVTTITEIKTIIDNMEKYSP